MRTLALAYLRLLKGVLVLLALCMVGMVFLNFVLRYGFGSGIAVSEELSRFALVWAGFIGATVLLIERRHMAVPGLVQRLPMPAARAVLLAGQALCLVASGFFLVGAWRQVLLNMAMSGAITGWPTGIALYGAGLFFAAHAVPVIAWQMGQLLRSPVPVWQREGA